MSANDEPKLPKWQVVLDTSYNDGKHYLLAKPQISINGEAFPCLSNLTLTIDVRAEVERRMLRWALGSDTRITIPADLPALLTQHFGNTEPRL